MSSGMNKFPEDAASGGAPVAGWPRRMFLYGRLAGSPIPMAPFLVWSSYVRSALRRTRPSLVPKRTAKPAQFRRVRSWKREESPEAERLLGHLHTAD